MKRLILSLLTVIVLLSGCGGYSTTVTLSLDPGLDQNEAEQYPPLYSDENVAIRFTGCYDERQSVYTENGFQDMNVGAIGFIYENKTPHQLQYSIRYAEIDGAEFDVGGFYGLPGESVHDCPFVSPDLLEMAREQVAMTIEIYCPDTSVLLESYFVDLAFTYDHQENHVDILTSAALTQDDWAIREKEMEMQELEAEIADALIIYSDENIDLYYDGYVKERDSVYTGDGFEDVIVKTLHFYLRNKTGKVFSFMFVEGFADGEPVLDFDGYSMQIDPVIELSYSSVDLADMEPEMIYLKMKFHDLGGENIIGEYAFEAEFPFELN